MKIGLYKRPDGKLVQVLGVGKEVGGSKMIAVYYVLGDTNKEGKLNYRACSVSKLNKLKPLNSEDLAYYANMG